MPPAARLTDMHTCPMVTPGIPPVPHVGGPILSPGAPTVLIGGLPAARVSDMAVCVGPPDVIVKGSATVLINFMPAARMGDSTAHGGVIVLGCPTVMIGDSGGGAAGGASSGGGDESAMPVTAGAGGGGSGPPSAGPASGAGSAPDAALTPFEIEEARRPGGTPLQQLCREKLVRSFYDSHPDGLGATRCDSALRGIDLTRPVEVVAFPPPAVMEQYVRRGALPGNWFDPIGGQSADSLGLNGSARSAKRFAMPAGQGLRSTANVIVEDWTDPGNPVLCTGGGIQMVVDDNVRDGVLGV